MGFNCGECRLPLVPLSDSVNAQLKAVMKKYGLVK